jgi:hypothetical protein
MENKVDQSQKFNDVEDEDAFIVSIQSTLLLTKNYVLKKEEYSTIQKGNDLCSSIVGVVFSLLQQISNDCFFVSELFSNKILNGTVVPLLKTNLFQYSVVMLPIFFNDAWFLCCVSIGKKVLSFVGLRSDASKINEWKENILNWLQSVAAQLKENFNSLEWNCFDMSRTEVEGTVDSGIYILLTSCRIASNYCYYVYNSDDCDYFRQALNGSLKNGFLPSIDVLSVNKEAIRLGFERENDVELLLDMQHQH